MRSIVTSIAIRLGAGLAAVVLFTSGCASGSAGRKSDVLIQRVNYNGWTNCLKIYNSKVEAVVVPEIGRVMSLRFHGGENIFWEDRSLDGQSGDWDKGWINFGGDKTWPAPEADWGKYTRRQEWQPPAAFDSMPVKGSVQGDDVVITSPIDPHFGIRTVRRIHLVAHKPIMRITTEYQRASGNPSKVGVWVITQFKSPEAVYVPVVPGSIFTNGYFTFTTNAWPQLEPKQGFISITRDVNTPHKMGSDAGQMLWVGKENMCLVESPRQAGRDYPDRGASVEVYTNPDPKQYVELETLGPLHTLARGQSIETVNTYTLMPRPKMSADLAARHVFTKEQ